MSERGSITGRVRRRTTTRAVRVAERVSRALITVGGIGTIVAVGTICVFLVSVVLPLFRGAALTETASAALAGEAPGAGAGSTGASSGGSALPLHVALSEDQRAAWALLPGGEVLAFDPVDGATLERRQVFTGRAPTAFDASLLGTDVAFGFADGSVQLGRIGFGARFLAADDPAAAEPALADLLPGQRVRWQKGVVDRTPEGQLRVQELQIALDEPLRSGTDAEVLLLAHASSANRTLLTVLKADGSLRREEVTRRSNLLTGKITTKVSAVDLPLQPRLGHGAPRFLVQSDLADSIVVAWPDGYAERFDVRDAGAPRLAETLQLAPGPQASLTALEPMLGSSTLITGDSAGGVCGWFLTRPADVAQGYELSLTRAHVLPAGRSAVTWVAPSARDRTLAAGYADGAVRLFHMTSGKVLAEVAAADAAGAADGAADRRAAGGGPGSAALVAMAPRADGVLALGEQGVRMWSVRAANPETSAAALLLPVWYEGASGPAHVWQSSSGTDDFEPKFGLWPLIFGTLKASFYSLLFSVPIALLAAVYTSEFLSRSMRARIKPVIEIMASLPSVVLGFLAAIVIAPVIERVVPETLAALATVPLAFVLGAHLWQLLPQGLTLRLSGVPRFCAMIVAVFGGLLLAVAWGPRVEVAFFGGDIKAWLNGRGASSVGGWLMLTLPLAVLVVVLARARLLAGWTRRVTQRWSRGRTAAFGLVLLLGSVAAVAAVALLLARMLDGAGYDPRGSFLGTYVQRNALVVGFLTGFAVIPIMYTLAEDALSSVPEHLRAASLAAGATPWQTAVRVVVPTAMSGIFSAVMIGIGRVVGETMIVLMAAGNTPVLDWNIFNGFRTLSATIAVELPEAVQGGTLYRVLFLAALALFAMTFVINTLAEVVRQRFRRRAYEL